MFLTTVPWFRELSCNLRHCIPDWDELWWNNMETMGSPVYRFSPQSAGKHVILHTFYLSVFHCTISQNYLIQIVKCEKIVNLPRCRNTIHNKTLSKPIIQMEDTSCQKCWQIPFQCFWISLWDDITKYPLTPAPETTLGAQSDTTQI